jgi:hypothetical protein
MGFGDYSTMGRDALRLLDEQVVGFLIGFVEDVGVNLGRYSRVGVLGKLRQHVNDVQLGAGFLRDVRCHPRCEVRVS